MKPIGIIIPTRWEARPVLRKLPVRFAGRNFYQGSIAGHSVLLRISGVGMDKAYATAVSLCNSGVGMLVSAGFCGALIPELQVGDVVTDRLTTALRPVRSRAERQALAQRANAVAVDMETQAIIEAGTRWGVPIRVVRVVSDTMDDDLSPLFGVSGKFSPLAIALRLLKPSVWPFAAKLRRNSAIASARLADALQAFLKSLPSQ